MYCVILLKRVNVPLPTTCGWGSDILVSFRSPVEVGLLYICCLIFQRISSITMFYIV